MEPEKDFNTALQEVQQAFQAIRAEGRETVKIVQEGNRFYAVIDSSSTSTTIVKNTSKR